MTGSYFSYLGPLVRCEVKMIPKDMYVTGCNNSGCSKFRKHSNDPYCSACGKATGAYPRTDSVPAVEPYELFGDKEPFAFFDGADDKHVLFLPNLDRGAPRKFFFDAYETTEVSFAPDGSTIPDERAWFVRAFAEEIEVLKRAYGPERVHVQWMLFTTVN